MSDFKKPDTAKALRVAMAIAGKKNKDVADSAGVSKTMVSRYLNGHVELSGETLHRIAAVFSMRSSEFLALGED